MTKSAVKREAVDTFGDLRPGETAEFPPRKPR
jgi:hypothetical protein